MAGMGTLTTLNTLRITGKAIKWTGINITVEYKNFSLLCLLTVLASVAAMASDRRALHAHN